jgi:hypothetical protein
VRPYFLLLLLLPILSACSNASGTRGAPGNTPPSAQSARPDSTTTALQPDSTSTANAPPSPRETPAVTDLRLAMESTLSSTKADINIPPFGLSKVMAAIRSMHAIDDSNSDGFAIALSDTAYNALSFDEKFTYNLIHGETYEQMCDPLPERPDEKDRIYGQTVDYFGEYAWSERQRSFFKDNRDSVEQLMKIVITQQGRVGMNLLDVIIETNATDMIPYLIDVYRRDNSNHYILTALMLLMKKNQYPEFMQSISYTKLYKRDIDTYSAYLVYNKANEDLIIQRAINYYKSAPQP